MTARVYIGTLVAGLIQAAVLSAAGVSFAFGLAFLIGAANGIGCAIAGSGRAS